MISGSSQPSFSQTVDTSTIRGKVLVGYQGWFRCPGDGSPGNRWSGWFHSEEQPAQQRIASTATRAWRVDEYPDVSGMNRSSLCPVPGAKIGGQQAFLFSSYPKATAETHFSWMREYNIDGALMQRFVRMFQQYASEHDDVLRNAVAAAEHNGRAIAVEYDITGANDATLFESMKSDWLYLTSDLKITSSPAYLHEKGKPVVSIWGLGVKDRIKDPNVALQIVQWFQNQGHATVMGGVPVDWARPSGDGQSDPGWNAVYKQLDIIQPWTPGRYSDAQSIAAWKNTHWIPDIDITRRNHQEYMPVIFPGYSWHNSKRDDTPTDRMNRIPRQGGSFLWLQAMSARAAGADMVKIAMFDEVNEGTAIFKIAPSQNAVPSESQFLTLDADGEHLPSDWYLRLTGDIARVYHGQQAVSMTVPAQPMQPSAR